MSISLPEKLVRLISYVFSISALLFNLVLLAFICLLVLKTAQKPCFLKRAYHGKEKNKNSAKDVCPSDFCVKHDCVSEEGHDNLKVVEGCHLRRWCHTYSFRNSHLCYPTCKADRE